VPSPLKERMKRITPQNYTGFYGAHPESISQRIEDCKRHNA